MITSLLAAILPIFNPVNAVLTDIEGTTTSISFVHDTLFPYAREHVQDYVIVHKSESAVEKILNEVQEIAGVSSENVVSTLLDWMAQDKKITPLKALQGMMWEEGYRQGTFKGHVYDDAYQQMRQWKNQGLSLYVYSSGSVQAQKLLFSYSTQGDITSLFTYYYDTKVGSKKESASYRIIAEQIGIAPEQILFLSDSIDELNAAKEAGMQTTLICREGMPAQDLEHFTITNFYEISLR